MKEWYTIQLQGCDDETTVEMQLSVDEVEFMNILVEKCKSASRYGCQPTIAMWEGRTTEG